MKVIFLIMLWLPMLAASQTSTDSTVVVNNMGDTIRYTTTYKFAEYAAGDSLIGRSTANRRRIYVSPSDLPINSATQTALNSKQATLVSATNIKTINGVSVLGSGDLVVSGGAVAWDDVTNKPTTTSWLSNSANKNFVTDAQAVVIGNTSGSNTGDNATNTQYSGLAASKENAISAGTTAQYWRGDKSWQTLDKAAVGLSNVTNESKATMFASPTFTGTVTLPASTSLTTPVIGVASGTSLSVSGGLISTSPSAGVGYGTGAGLSVVQGGNKTTGVTINSVCGAITTANTSMNAAAEIKFTVTNSRVAATDVPYVCIKSGGTSGAYLISVSAVAAGSFDITITNASAGALGEAIVISFIVIKAVTN